MKTNYGATPADWTHFADRLKLRADLLPVVSNPDAPISPLSKMVDKGKTPSRYNGDRQVGGITKWTQVSADTRDIARWSREPDYGICLQTRLVRAMDIDVPDVATADAIEQAMRDAVPGVHFPRRWRANSGKRLLPFRYAGELTKRTIKVDGGIIELLATGQQFVAVGTHPSGARYEWDGGLPEAFPELTGAELEELCAALELAFGLEEWKVARVARERAALAEGEDPAGGDDDVAAYLAEHGLILDEGVGGQVHIECPWKAGHSGDSGVTETSYFPAGTGGFDCGHFKCLHASCEGRTDEDFLDAIGFNADTEFRTRDFPLLPTGSVIPAVPGLEDGGDLERAARAIGSGRLPAVPADTAPALKRDAQSRILVTQDNVSRAFECPEFVTRKLRYDEFTAGPVWAWWNEADGAEVWQPWSDVDNARAMRTLDRRGFKATPGIETIRRAVLDVADLNKVDTAMMWLRGLEWDGVDRCERFLIDYMGAEDTPYVRAVGRYMWTTLAGRCLQPGVKADMAVVLVTEQGTGKTSMIEALVPDHEWFGEIDFQLDDADNARIMRGKLVCEMAELKGLKGKDAASIKKFISARYDEWTPKYQETAKRLYRRVLFIGTTNDDDFLADPTGERRWLPLRIKRALLEAIKRDRDLLWAEARERFRHGGIDWEEAETLARAEHDAYKDHDPLQDKVQAWAEEPGLGGHVPIDHGFTLEAMVEQCLGMEFVRVSRADQYRYGRILRALGYIKGRSMKGGVREMVWSRKQEEK